MVRNILYRTLLIVYAAVLCWQLVSAIHIPDYVYSRSEELDSEEIIIQTPNFTDIQVRPMHECTDDRNCDQQEFCHAGEGHRVCLPCRRNRRRCHRDSMCCGRSTCRRGVCLHPSKHGQGHVDAISSSEEDSISQHTKDEIFTAHEGAPCNHKNDCMPGLCCAHHFWRRICKRILDEDDVCTKPSKRQRHLPAFERCPCGEGLSCKRDPSGESRLHTCQRMKHRTT
ncbi:dickkopf-related protein 2-like [Ptychodera flava]|uniref:dickkopf-related protein 2-like n=1 Tax=Ptychodera flava TaxID=63121 RepID=UPI00396A4C82